MLYNADAGKSSSADGWIIVVRGNERPPVHVHVLHPDRKAAVYQSGRVVNAGVPARVLRVAQAWIDANTRDVRREWVTMNNRRRR